MADSTLTAIRTKVRRLTRSPSAQQITNAEIDEYVNTFVLYDFPEHIRLNFLRRNLSFYTEPNIDSYRANTRQSLAEGDGTTTTFSGTLSDFPIFQNQFNITGTDVSGNPIFIYDDGAGALVGDVGVGVNTINYTTGAWAVEFAATSVPAPYLFFYANSTLPSNPLFDFANRYTNVYAPVYIDGKESLFTQSREQFFSWYPFNSSVETIATGDGVTTSFSGTLSDIPVLRNEVVFTSIDANNNGLRISDDGAGFLVGDQGSGTNTINYVTGAYDFNFDTAPASGETISARTVPYVAGRPDTVLFLIMPSSCGPFPIRSIR